MWSVSLSGLVFILSGCAATTALLGDGESGIAADSGGAGQHSSVAALGGAAASAGGAVDVGTGGAALALGGAVALGGSAASGGAAPRSTATAPFDAAQLDAATALCGKSPWILSGAVPNSRGLGGVPLPIGAVHCERLYRGSQLNALSAAGCTELANLGVRSVIDLRTASEAAVAPDAACVGKLARRVAAPMPTPYSLSAQDYIADLHAHASLLAIFETLADPAAYPVYFHCIYGRDRTGVLSAVLLRLVGASRDVIMTEYMRTAAAGMGAAPASLEATLDELDRLGGAETFLISIGVSPEAIAVVRSQIVDLATE